MSDRTLPSTLFLDRFRSVLQAKGVNALRYDDFVHLALYDPIGGYYRAGRRRVGRAPGTDFYTASTSGRWFGELVVAASVTLLRGRSPAGLTFVEIGAEPETTVLEGVVHPFAAAEVRRLGDPLNLDGSLIVFSNELFDAQPFRRFVVEGGNWCELGVRLAGENFDEVKLGPVQEPWLPPVGRDRYHFDAPRAAIDLLNRLLEPSWKGVFIACDYGKSLRELAEATPQGTARTYWKHQQSNELLSRPGEQDLTVHVCWDWLVECLQQHGCQAVSVTSQEAFFMRHAASYLESSLAAEGGLRSPRKQALLQLLHPAHLGQKFQVLSAERW